jgi:hypothetical protein
MSIENLEEKNNPTSETEKAGSKPNAKTSKAPTGKEKEVVALSLQGDEDKPGQAIKFKDSPNLPGHRPIGVSTVHFIHQDGLLPNNRPIAANSMHFSENYSVMGNRPVESSHLNVISEYNSVGGTRPVVSSGLKISSSITVSGNRPIVASALHISESYAIMGNRPVADNDIDDPLALMGYID